MRGTPVYSAALLATAVLTIVPAAAPAQQRQAIRQLVIYGNDPCPQGRGDDIVVCARRPETERYRIPPETNVPGDNDPASRSWAARARAVDAASEPGTDAVESCSTVGGGGQTGCLKDIISDSRVGWNAADPVKPPQ